MIVDQILHTVISFRYRIGSRAGDRRMVYIISQTNDNIVLAYDYTVGGLRSYKIDLLEDMQTHSFVRVEFSTSYFDLCRIQDECSFLQVGGGYGIYVNLDDYYAIFVNGIGVK